MKTSVYKKLYALLISTALFITTTYAQIVYTDVKPDSVIGPKSYSLDLNNDGIKDFKLTTAILCGHCGEENIGCTFNVQIIPAKGTLNAIINDGKNSALALDSLAIIGNSGSKWSKTNPPAQILNCRSDCGRCGGSTIYWKDYEVKYLGLRITIGSNTYYGWVRLSTSTYGPLLTVKDYAFNSKPNQPILAGAGVKGSQLPLTLINFNSVLKNSIAGLTWTTANETNNSGFDVEKSTDGQNFSAIGFINGKGNTSSETKYSFTDGNLKNGINYYRLKQTDYDGNFKYSSVIKIAYTNGNANAITIAPNPFSNSTTISFTLSQSQKVSVGIFDINGRLVKTLANAQMQPGTHQFIWNAEDEKGSIISSGIYFLKFENGNYFETKKLVVVK